MEGLKRFSERGILRKPLCSNQEQTSSPTSMRKPNQKPVFEGQIKTTFILDESDSSLSPTEVIEALHEDELDERTPKDPQSRRKNWLRQAISVDGERVSGKLIHQCSLDHGYTRQHSTMDKKMAPQKPPQENGGDENDLEDLQSERALVEAELRRQSKAPPGIKIRDLLASQLIIEDEDDEENESAETEEGPRAFDQNNEVNDRNNAQIKLA